MKNKIIISILSILWLVAIIAYFSSSKLTKNAVKHKMLHRFGLLDSEWEINTQMKDEVYTTSLNSPTLLIDDIYGSMEGPFTYKRFMLNENEDQLYWITGFDANVNTDLEHDSSSDDFICHVNF